MAEGQIISMQAGAQPLVKKAYTMSLIRRGTEDGRLTAARQQEILLALHRAVAERAAAYTRGQSATVTKKQAEAFYISVLYQLDAALLAFCSDEKAEEALCTEPVDTLLNRGQVRILELFEDAKTCFRQAYRLTKPFETAFFHDLLKDFAKFTTQYDARFHADAIEGFEVYPLLGGYRIGLPGVLGVHAYYSALMMEGELLQMFPRAQVQKLMKRYARRYLTAPDMIAENIADLVLRQWLCRALLGDTGLALTMPEDAVTALTERFLHTPPEQIAEQMRSAIAQSGIAENEPVCKYCTDAVPFFADALHRRATENKLDGWITAEYREDEA